MLPPKDNLSLRERAGRPVLAIALSALAWAASPKPTEALTEIQTRTVSAAISKIDRLTPVAIELARAARTDIFPEDMPRNAMIRIMGEAPLRLELMLERGQIRTFASDVDKTERGIVSKSVGAFGRDMSDDVLVLAADPESGRILAGGDVLPGAMIHEGFHFLAGPHSFETTARTILEDMSKWGVDEIARFAIEQRDVPYMAGDLYIMADWFSDISRSVPREQIGPAFEKYPDLGNSICISCEAYGIGPQEVRHVLEFTYDHEREWRAEHELARTEGYDQGSRR